MVHGGHLVTIFATLIGTKSCCVQESDYSLNIQLHLTQQPAGG